MPVLNIKDPEAYKLASNLAGKTGKSLTRVVVDALRAETIRFRVHPQQADRAKVDAVLDRIASKLNADDTRTPDEIIGYDERGLPA